MLRWRCQVGVSDQPWQSAWDDDVSERHRQVSRERGLVEAGWSGKRGDDDARDPIDAGHRYPAEIISYAVWLYFQFPLSLRMVEEMLAHWQTRMAGAVRFNGRAEWCRHNGRG